MSETDLQETHSDSTSQDAGRDAKMKGIVVVVLVVLVAAFITDVQGQTKESKFSSVF